MTDPTPTPTPRDIQRAWMRQQDALQSFIGHPGASWDPVKEAQAAVEAAIPADERAALADRGTP